MFDGVPLGLRHIGGGLAEHGHEPGNICGFVGVADVVLAVLFRGNDPISFGVEEAEEWQTRITAADFRQKVCTPRVFESLLVGAFVDVQLYQDEVLLEDRLDLFGLDKLIESLAPPSPGGIESEKDRFVLGRGLGFSLGQDLVGA